jgi:L-alanine-DL-glutamate epimerase-like enolase superfamily enzyme
MRIVDIRDATIRLQGGMANAVVSFADHTVSLVALITDQIQHHRPVVGFGFNSIGRYAQSGILRERMAPRVLAAPEPDLLTADASQFDAAAISRIAMRNEKPGGHGDRAGALGALELAVWDLNAKLAQEPAYATIARSSRNEPANLSVPVYAAGGYYYGDDSLARLQGELQGYREQGFDAFKIKIGGAPLEEDRRRIDAALEIAGDGAHLAVDANGRFDLTQALEYAIALTPLELRWFEEPGDPLNYALNNELAQAYGHPLATGENLFSVADLDNLVAYGGMRPAIDIFQMDAGLSYGLTEYTQMLELLERKGYSRSHCYPHGGHLINLHISAGLGLGGCEAYPGVFQPFGGYSDACQVEHGRVRPSDAPGYGLEQKLELRPHLEALAL